MQRRITISTCYNWGRYNLKVIPFINILSMKRFLLLAISCFILSSVHAEEWGLIWSDEFDYSGEPDNSKWSFDTQGNDWDWGNNEAQNYTPKENRNAWVENGNLVIEARKESWRWWGDGETKQYTSARVISKGKGDWTYGKFEVRALLPKGRGMWPAIWMLPTDEVYGGWPKSGELDIMENVGFDPLKIHCNIHTEAYHHSINTNKGNTVTTSNPSENWHIYSLEWFEDNVTFYLDGNMVFSFDKEQDNNSAVWPFDQRFHLLMNIAVGGGWGGEQGIDDSVFPQRMLVDYVRVYEQQNSTETELVRANRLKVTPSFATESVNICGGEEGVVYQLVSIQGVTVSSNVSIGTLDVSSLPKGIYYLCKDGKRVASFLKK